jgi:hypothetical protein
MAFGRLLSRHMNSTPSELLHCYKGFRYVAILGDEECCEMKRKLLWVENMRRDFGKIWGVDRQT